MPTYTYLCPKCSIIFELFLCFSDYNEIQVCPECDYTQAKRELGMDIQTIHSNVVAGDDEIKVGQLADRNTKRLSRDEKIDKYYEQNKYKYEGPDKTLPTGMTRVNKKDKDTVMKQIETKIK